MPLDLAAGTAIIDQLTAWAAAGQCAPARLLAGEGGFVEWAHYPHHDAIDPVSGWRFYYHTHNAAQRPRAEHGHFHIFVPAPAGRFSHLIALSVDDKGLPLRLFTTNRWVTGETWQNAETLIAQLANPALSHAAPRDVGQWLSALLSLYRDEITALLRARDARLGADVTRLDDRRLRLPSRRRITLAHKLSSAV
ncbi:DUF6969 family protein [Acidocella sp.]|uniref:DUF6969 family protein n=1 Tax=Acidocella sp. TaxID=50710 RepID=UPI00260F071D|nr:hypothetical protein [Acidocella sp.]